MITLQLWFLANHYISLMMLISSFFQCLITNVAPSIITKLWHKLDNEWPKFRKLGNKLGYLTQKWPKSIKIWAQFRTAWQVYHKYLQNGTKYLVKRNTLIQPFYGQVGLCPANWMSNTRKVKPIWMCCSKAISIGAQLTFGGATHFCPKTYVWKIYKMCY